MLIEHSVPANMAHLRDLLESVDRICEAAGADPAFQHDMRLVVEEALVNVISHAYAGLPMGQLHLALSCVPWAGRAAVRADIRDWGHPFNPLSSAAPDVSAEAEDRPVGGMGVMLMRKLSDAQAYSHDGEQGNHLTLVKFLRVSPLA